jgi:hypothetical protein
MVELMIALEEDGRGSNSTLIWYCALHCSNRLLVGEHTCCCADNHWQAKK